MPAVGLQAMKHEVNPKIAILDSALPITMDLAPCMLLVAIYQRPEQTSGGVFLPDKTRQEDLYQGKTGLVLARGPLCFQNSARYDFAGFEAEVEEWVVFRVSDGFPLTVNSVPCRILRDSDIQAVVSHPDVAY